MSESTYLGVVTLIIFFVLTVYSLGGSFFEAKHIHVIHETGLGILLGIGVGLLVNYSYHEQMVNLTSFNTEFFFYFLLPIIIFSGGYNLNKKRFFQNFLYINLFGLFGTLICFLFIVGCTYFVNEQGWITQWNDSSAVIHLNIYHIMMFSATICATDSVAALTMIKPEKHPKLFSVVFGEGMVNDAVSIIIFLSVNDLAAGNRSTLDFYWYTPFLLIADFLKAFSLSILIGGFFGIVATWIFKKMRFLSHSCVLETAITLYMGFMSFTVCEMSQLSGVLSILVTGILLAHYNFYNISPIGKITSQVTIQTVSLICESAIYVYIGVCIWTLTITENENNWSWNFVLYELVICFAGRMFSMALLSGIVILIKGKRQWRLSIWELSVIWFAGLIRGSIAYALITQVEHEEDDKQQIQVLQNTILIMVILTTIVLGGLMPCYININLRQDQSQSKVMKRSTLRDTLIRQLEVPEESEASKRYRSSLQKLVKRIDEKYIKPFLIFNYEARKKEIMRSKKMLKMNNANFDPTQFGRMTGRMTLMNQQQHSGSFQAPGIFQQDGVESARQSERQSARQSQGFEKQSGVTKITIRSGMHSKYMGNQQVTFDLDVPIYFDEAPIKGNNSEGVINEEHESDQEREEEEEDSERVQRGQEISISKIMPQDG